MDKNRIAEIGDLIFEQVGDFRYTGVVYKITANKWNHKTVFIKWVSTPNCYRKSSGYLASNIHNQRRRFDLVKV